MAVININGAQIGTTDERLTALVAELRDLKPGGVVVYEGDGIYSRIPYESAVSVAFDRADPLAQSVRSRNTD